LKNDSAQAKARAISLPARTPAYRGRLADNIRQDFYAMTTVSNIPASVLRKADKKLQQEYKEKEIRYEYRAT
jgi:hypothetical protein